MPVEEGPNPLPLHENDRNELEAVDEICPGLTAAIRFSSSKTTVPIWPYKEHWETIA